MTDNFDFYENFIAASAGHRQSSDKAEAGKCCAKFLTDPVIAMAYVPMQGLGSTYEPAEGLCSGTLFPELNLPFKGRMI